MRRISTATLALLLTALGFEGAAAQATALPTFYAPTRGFGAWEAGVTLSRPGGDLTAIEGRYGAVLHRADLQLRLGYVDDVWAGGVEARLPAIGRSPTFPLDGAIILGVGRTFRSGGGGPTIVPIGLSLGRRIHLDGSALHVTPYAQPTVLIVSDTRFALGLGVDVGIRGMPDVRLAWALGDMDGFSIGLFWPR